jgi:hypothetical protein
LHPPYKWVTSARVRYNADGRRALIEPDGVDMPPDDSQRKDGQLPPLLKKILEDYSATGMPPAYLPKTPPSQNGEAP